MCTFYKLSESHYVDHIITYLYIREYAQLYSHSLNAAPIRYRICTKLPFQHLRYHTSSCVGVEECICPDPHVMGICSFVFHLQRYCFILIGCKKTFIIIIHRRFIIPFIGCFSGSCLFAEKNVSSIVIFIKNSVKQR